jgi:hypothetical protein
VGQSPTFKPRGKTASLTTIPINGIAKGVTPFARRRHTPKKAYFFNPISRNLSCK